MQKKKMPVQWWIKRVFSPSWTEQPLTSCEHKVCVRSVELWLIKRGVLELVHLSQEQLNVLASLDRLESIQLD